MRKRVVAKRRTSQARVCPNCAMIVHKPVDRCPRCDGVMATQRDDNVVDKAGADSFPASDPPQH
jgi:uncharacterized C2H2 Zn-finger protein